MQLLVEEGLADLHSVCGVDLGDAQGRVVAGADQVEDLQPLVEIGRRAGRQKLVGQDTAQVEGAPSFGGAEREEHVVEVGGERNPVGR